MEASKTIGNQLAPDGAGAPQQKLEWVTPKISLMEAGDTEGKSFSISELDASAGPS